MRTSNSHRSATLVILVGIGAYLAFYALSVDRRTVAGRITFNPTAP